MKTKKILAAIAALAIVCGAVPSQPFANIVKNSAVTANAETSAEDFYIDPRDRRIISYYGSDKDIVIPSGVLSIGNFAFAYNDTLNSVIIPNGVKDIITCAFVCCKNLTSVIIPYSVTDIGEDAFSECDNLTISGYTGSAAETYAAEKGIKFISLGEHDKSKDFEFDAETGTITKYVGTDAEVVIPSEIDGVAVTSIGDYAFSWCSSLESITISDSVTSIGNGAFYDCTSLTNITIPDGVTNIGGDAFWNCGNLTNVIIPDSVISIGDNPFSGCDNLTISGYAGSAAETYATENGFEFIALDDKSDSNIVEEGKCGENVTYTLDADGVLTISGNGDMYDYEDSAFSQTPFRGSEIKKIIIEDGITSIGNNVFHSYLDEVTEISIPDSVTRIGVGSMSGLRITKLVIPEGVTTIGAGAFYCLYSLEDITIPSSVTSIGGDAFFGTKWMESKWSENPLVVVNGILISSNIVNEESITIPDNVTTIGEGVFMGHTEMKNVTIPDSVKTIEKTAFYGCQNLTSVKIPDGVSSIGERAFFGCNSMDSIEIPASVTSIEKNALGFKITNEGTVKLENFTISGYKGSAAETYATENGFEFIALEKTPDSNIVEEGKCGENVTYTLDADGVLTISGTGDMEDFYMYQTPWRYEVRRITIESGVTSIGSFAFLVQRSLESVKIPDSVTSIGYSAFHGCENLKSITIPDSVAIIDERAFFNCGLTSITIPESVTSIGPEAFANCESLTRITIPESVTSIGENAFSGCDNLTISGYNGSAAETYAKENGFEFIAIDDSEETSDFEFDAETGTITKYNGTDAEVVIPAEIDGVAVKAIGDEAFGGCSSLTSVTIPDSVTEIGGWAFMHCYELKEVKLSDSITSISSGLFTQCIKLESITIPEGVTSIEEYAFQNCAALKSVTIPDSVTNIAHGSFIFCISLASITIPDGVTELGDTAFNGCENLTEVTIPKSVTKFGVNVFKNFDDHLPAIKGYAGSAAETYAKENGFEFIALEDKPITETKLGDVDGDGKITSIDASAALTYYVMKPEKIEDLGFPFNKEAADWDKNGIIDSRDASEILTYYVSHN